MTTIRSMVLAALGLFMLLAIAAPQPAAALTDGATVQNVYWHHRYYHRHHHWRHYGFDQAPIHQA